MKYIAQPKGDITNPRIFYFVESRQRALRKRGLLHWFTVVERPTLATIPEDIKGSDIILVSGSTEELKAIAQLITVHVPKKNSDSIKDLESTDPTQSHYLYGVLIQDKYALLIKLSDDSNYAPYRPEDEFYLEEGMIENYHGAGEVTDVGKFLVNYVVYASVFGDMIPYLNKSMTPGDLDKPVAKLIMDKKTDREHYTKYLDHGSWLFSHGAIFVQAFSEKAMTTSPEVLKRKKELLEKYKDKLDDPNVIVAIEEELIKMDKEYLKGDESEPFLTACGGKVFKECRKKMFIMYGLCAGFVASDGFQFNPDSLESGWRPNTLNIAMNEIRKGSYNRGVETAKGGAESKFVLRTFQETKITMDDCGDKIGMNVELTEDNWKEYIDRYDTANNVLTEDFLKKNIGKVLSIRSPMSCKCKDGFCFKCCGVLFEKTNKTAIGVQGLEVTETFTSIAMSAMHVSGIGRAECPSFDDYVI